LTDRQAELEAAANGINPASLQAARSAVAASCREHLRWAEMFSRRLESLKPEELHKFVRAFCLTLLGHLPTRPGTCPFCIQYGHDKSCRGCGYAAAHGRCDSDNSAFSIFIEAFQELGWAIYRDIEGRPADHPQAAQIMRRTISATRERALRMEEEMQGCRTMQLMMLKAQYLEEMVKLLPLSLLSAEVEVRALRVKDALQRYW
jgi:hypothetical protein